MQTVAGECPMGCGRTLFLGEGGHVTCSLVGCPDPCAAADLLAVQGVHGTAMKQTSNARDCFSECVGHKVVGVLFDALPVGRRDLSGGTKTLVFENGQGLTISARGFYWIESAEEVRRAVRSKRAELDRVQGEIEGVLALAGAL